MENPNKESVSIIGRPRHSRLSLAESTMDPEMITTPLQPKIAKKRSSQPFKPVPKEPSYIPGIDKHGNHCKLYDNLANSAVEVTMELKSISNIMGAGNNLRLKVLCMGQDYTDIDVPSPIHGLRDGRDDINVNHQVKVRLHFDELIDNPILIELIETELSDDPLEPQSIGNYYGCIDALSLFKFNQGKILSYSVQLLGSGRKKEYVRPVVNMSINLEGGLPTEKTIRKGNIITITMDSMRRIPTDMARIAEECTHSDMEIYFTLPFPDSGKSLVFPMGKYVKDVSSNDESKIDYVKSHFSLDENKEQTNKPVARPKGEKYWASVMESWPEAPREAAIFEDDEQKQNDGLKKQSWSNFEGSEEKIFGDMEENDDITWKNYISSPDARVSWNSVHKKYLDVGAYKQLLEAMSKSVIWPIEVSMTITRALDKDSTNANNTVPNSQHSVAVKKGLSSARDVVAVSQNAPNSKIFPGPTGLVAPPPTDEDTETSDGHKNNGKQTISSRRLLDEGKYPRASAPMTHVETIIIYHGLALVDFTQMLNPGVTVGRYACRLLPYSDKLLREKTCVTRSAFLAFLQGLTNARNNGGDGAQDPGKKHSTASLEHEELTVSGRKKKSKSKHHPQSGKNKSGRKSDIKIQSLEKPSITNQQPHIYGQTDVPEPTHEENLPFVLFKIELFRAFVPLFTTEENHKGIDNFIPQREIPRRTLITANMAEEKFRRSVIEAAADLSQEFTKHYLQRVLGQDRPENLIDPKNPSSSFDTLKKGFLFYLNASGRYLVLREHLRSAICKIVQQRAIKLKDSGFPSSRDFQNYIHDMYIHLVDQMHEVLSVSQMKEIDPSDTTRKKSEVPENNNGSGDAPLTGTLYSIAEHARTMRNLLTAADEAFAQGDFKNCHRLHLQRISRSMESPYCWLDFSAMWFNRGDDRLAEIAAREALKRQKDNVLALIIMGIIAAKHEDEQGLNFLLLAESWYPYCPEIQVLLGVYYNLLGNEIASEQCFKKGCYLHHILTGQTTQYIDEMFKSVSEPFKVKTALSELQKFAAMNKLNPEENELLPEREDINRALSSVRVAEQSHKNIIKYPDESPPVHSSSKNSQKSSSHRPSSASLETMTKKIPSGSSQHSKRKSEGKLHKSNEQLHSPSVPAVHESASVKKTDSVQKPQPQASRSLKLPSDLPESVTDEVIARAILPEVKTNIMIASWDVTQHLDERKRCYLEQMATMKPNSPGSEPIEEAKVVFSSDLDSKKSMYEPTDKKSTSAGMNSIDSTTTIVTEKKSRVTKDGILEDVEDEEEAGGILPQQSARKSNVIPATSDVKVMNSVMASATMNNIASNPLFGTLMVESSHAPMDRKTTPDFENSGEGTEKSDGDNTNKLINRQGSELIWTAQLLMRLGIYDWVDAVLAREIHFGDPKSVSFSYLRAMSLLLRNEVDQALAIIEDILKKYPDVDLFWTAKGHCHYSKKDTSKAAECYEKALRLPNGKENRHLLLLRFGSICLEKDEAELAKRVFLLGVQKHPSPYMWLAIGHTCYQLKQFQEAETAYSEANRLDHTSPTIWGHLALVSLAQENQSLAEQSYKWALRFGLKRGKLMEEIKRLQKEKGYGDPSFPRIPTCIPHDYYLQRLGRLQPFNVYKESLDLKKKIVCPKKQPEMTGWPEEEEEEFEEEEDGFVPDEGADDLLFNFNGTNDFEEEGEYEMRNSYWSEGDDEEERELEQTLSNTNTHKTKHRKVSKPTKKKTRKTTKEFKE